VPAQDWPCLPNHRPGPAAQAPAGDPEAHRAPCGRAKLLVLRMKPRARKQVAKRKRLLVREKVRAGKVTATVTKIRRLIRR